MLVFWNDQISEDSGFSQPNISSCFGPCAIASSFSRLWGDSVHTETTVRASITTAAGRTALRASDVCRPIGNTNSCGDGRSDTYYMIQEDLQANKRTFGYDMAASIDTDKF